ncbi:MAG: hypothetical protein ACYC4Q_07975 [Victivallaceae bacterium]
MALNAPCAILTFFARIIETKNHATAFKTGGRGAAEIDFQPEGNVLAYLMLFL